MAKNAVALIVAGSGEITETEVNDLLLDRWPDEDWVIDLVVPVNKDLFTPAVQTVVDWYDDDPAVYPVREKDGSNLSRRSAALGDGSGEEVENFAQIFNKDDFKEWDESFFLVAMPEDPEDTDYDMYAQVVEDAIEAGFEVLNLCRGLDDVRLEPDNEDPEPEPEPEPDPPKRTRKKRSEPEPKAEGHPAETKPARKRPTVKDELHPEPSLGDEGLNKVRGALERAYLYFSTHDKARAVYDGTEKVTPSSITTELSEALDVLEGAAKAAESSAPAKDEEPEEKPKRTRGRPRTNFEVNQVWDEDLEKWVARPKGRLAKGTKWRKIHEETDEVLEEGEV